MARPVLLASSIPQVQPLTQAKVNDEHWISRLPWLVGLISLALNLGTAWISGFDGLYGQDAYAYFAHAVELNQRGSLFHHWQWDAAPRLLFWPMGYPALVALLFTITGVSAWASQLVSIVAMAATAGFTSVLTLRLGFFKTNRSRVIAALFAGCAVTLSPLGRQAGLTVMADALALALTTIALWLAVEARSRRNGLLLVAAGFTLALAASTRYSALTVLPAILAGSFRVPSSGFWASVSLNRKILAEQSPVKKTQNSKSGIRNPELIFAALALGLGSLPQTWINWAWPQPFWDHPWLTGWSPLNYGRTVFDTPDGHAVYSRPPLVFYAIEPFLNVHFLTPLVIPLALAGFGVLWLKQRRNWRGWTLLIWWLAPVLFYSGIPYENERFTLSFLPPLAIITGIGLGATYEWVANFWQIKNAFGLGLLLTFLGLLGLGWAGQRHMEGFFNFKNSELTIVQTTERSLPVNARLITFEVSLTYDHYYPIRPVYDLSALDQVRIEQLNQDNHPLYLLVEPEVMERQFGSTPIGTSYRAAHSLANGDPVLQIGSYRLWRLH